jgi:hypothetical protein
MSGRGCDSGAAFWLYKWDRLHRAVEYKAALGLGACRVTVNLCYVKAHLATFSNEARNLEFAISRGYAEASCAMTPTKCVPWHDSM